MFSKRPPDSRPGAAPTRRNFLLASGAAVAAPLLWTRRASAAQRVVLRSSGGSYDEIRKKLIYEPFQKQTGIEVVVVAANIAKMLAMMKAGGGELDAIDVGADAVYSSRRPAAWRRFPTTASASPGPTTSARRTAASTWWATTCSRVFLASTRRRCRPDANRRPGPTSGTPGTSPVRARWPIW